MNIFNSSDLPIRYTLAAPTWSADGVLPAHEGINIAMGRQELHFASYAENVATEKHQEIQMADKYIAALEGVIKAIPACHAHGDLCIPHALEWIARRRDCLERNQCAQGVR